MLNICSSLIEKHRLSLSFNHGLKQNSDAHGACIICCVYCQVYENKNKRKVTRMGLISSNNN